MNEKRLISLSPKSLTYFHYQKPQMLGSWCSAQVYRFFAFFFLIPVKLTRPRMVKQQNRKESPQHTFLFCFLGRPRFLKKLTLGDHAIDLDLYTGVDITNK